MTSRWPWTRCQPGHEHPESPGPRSPEQTPRESAPHAAVLAVQLEPGRDPRASRVALSPRPSDGAAATAGRLPVALHVSFRSFLFALVLERDPSDALGPSTFTVTAAFAEVAGGDREQQAAAPAASEQGRAGLGHTPCAHRRLDRWAAARACRGEQGASRSRALCASLSSPGHRQDRRAVGVRSESVSGNGQGGGPFPLRDPPRTTCRSAAAARPRAGGPSPISAVSLPALLCLSATVGATASPRPSLAPSHARGSRRPASRQRKARCPWASGPQL